MGYERYPRETGQGDDYGEHEARDYGSGRDYSYSSARDYRAAGQMGGDRDERDRYGNRDYGNQRYAQREQAQGGRDYYGGRGGSGMGGGDRYTQGRSGQGDAGRGGYGQGSYGQSGYDRDSYGQGGGYDRDRPSMNRYVERNRYGADAGSDRGGDREYHGSYGSGSRRFEDYGASAHADDDNYRNRPSSGREQGQRQGYGRQPQGYDYEDRGFFARAGDEVRSWFGDEDAERRREYDSRMDERAYGDHDQHRDNDYHSWRRGQIQSLDRDYDEYRRENRSKFENEFGAWRSTRQTQRDALNKVEEHMDVVGSDGEHVGTVDKVRGDRILLTKNDADAGGRHHSIPSSWLQTVDTKVTLGKSAADAKKAWRDEERNQAMFGDDNDDRSHRSATGARTDTSTTTQSGATATSQSSTDSDGKTLNRSFSGTY